MGKSNVINLNRVHTKADQGYRWRDKDATMDAVCALIRAKGWTAWDVEVNSGVRYGTIKNWMDGKTRKPQAHTMRYVLRALDYSRLIWDLETGELIPIPIDRAQRAP